VNTRFLDLNFSELRYILK